MNFTRRGAIAAATLSGLALAASGSEAQERHPAIRNAIRALERAKADLQHAEHDFGGHRVDAIAACDKAIEQLRLALQYANK